MKKAVKVAALSVAAVGVLLLVAAGVVRALSEHKRHRIVQLPKLDTVLTQSYGYLKTVAPRPAGNR